MNRAETRMKSQGNMQPRMGKIDKMQDMIFAAHEGDRLISVATTINQHALTISNSQNSQGGKLLAQAEATPVAKEHAADAHEAHPGGNESAEAEGKAAEAYQLPHEIPYFYTLIEAARGKIHPEH